MKIACIILYWGVYHKLGTVAANSFAKYHPNIDLFQIGDHNRDDYISSKYFRDLSAGTWRFMLAVELMQRQGYDKVILLGADTITCGRLDEFLDDNEHDILASLDYPYQLQEYDAARRRTIALCPDAETHLNADVICFNNVQSIIDIIVHAKFFSTYGEQGALNYVVWLGGKFSTRIVDGPHESSLVVYNVRAKGNVALEKIYHGDKLNKPWGSYLQKFYICDGKLFTGTDKQIKVWHYCDGLGNLNNKKKMILINSYISSWFNQETKDFFRDHCAAGNFFHEEFIINE